MKFKDNVWLWLVLGVLVVFVLDANPDFLGGVLEVPSFTYSSFVYSGSEPRLGDLVLDDDEFRVGALRLGEGSFVSMSAPRFVCDHNKYLVEHGMSAPSSFEDVECWVSTITFEGDSFVMHPGDEKVINDFLKIKYRVSGPVSWDDFKCVYEKDGVKYAEPVSCSFSKLDDRFRKGWIGSIDFFVDLDGLSGVLVDDSVNLRWGSEHEARVEIKQEIFKRVSGGVRLVQVQEGFSQTPEVEWVNKSLLKGHNVLGVEIPTSALGIVSSEQTPFVRVSSPHFEWIGLSKSILSKEYGVKKSAFFEGLEDGEEFRTTRDLPVSEGGSSSVGGSSAGNVFLFFVIITIIVAMWYFAFRRKGK